MVITQPRGNEALPTPIAGSRSGSGSGGGSGAGGNGNWSNGEGAGASGNGATPAPQPNAKAVVTATSTGAKGTVAGTAKQTGYVQSSGAAGIRVRTLALLSVGFVGFVLGTWP